MKKLPVRPIALLLSIGCFVASLPLDAAVYERTTHGGWFMLLMGWMGLLMFHVGWCANPLIFGGWISLAFAKRRAGRLITLVFFGLALLFAVTSYFTLAQIEMVGRNEGELAGDLDHFGPAIFLWTASICIGLIGAGVRWVELKREPLAETE